MKKLLLMVSVIATLLVSTVVYAEQTYNTPIRETQNDVPDIQTQQRQTNYEDLTARAQANQQRLEQAVRSYEMNYNDSYTRFWDRYTDAYQKSKKITN